MNTTNQPIGIQVVGYLDQERERFGAVILLRRHDLNVAIHITPFQCVGFAVLLLFNAFAAGSCNLVNRLAFGLLLRKKQ